MLHLDADDRKALATIAIYIVAAFVGAIVTAITLGTAFRTFEIVSGL